MESVSAMAESLTEEKLSLLLGLYMSNHSVSFHQQYTLSAGIEYFSFTRLVSLTEQSLT
jgi:hypothetical protein